MKRFYLLFLIILFFLIGDVIFYFLGVQPLSPWELKENFDSIIKESILIDVRLPVEYKAFHIDQVLQYPNLFGDPDAYDYENDIPVIVVSLMGHRASLTAYQLKKRGVKTVYSLTGGMLGWKIAGGSIICEYTKEYEKKANNPIVPSTLDE